MKKFLAAIILSTSVVGVTAVDVTHAQMAKEPAAAIKPAVPRPAPTPMQPGRTAIAPVPKVYPDSTKFEGEWKAFYPMIKPPMGIHERAVQIFRQMSRVFSTRGVDSAAAWDSAMKKLDLKMDEKMVHDAYRAEFSADEMKSINEFMKTPAGKHYLEVAPKLSSAANQVSAYVQRTINATIQPMMKPLPVDPKAPPRPGMPGYRPGAPRGAQVPGAPNGAPAMNGSATNGSATSGSGTLMVAPDSAKKH